MGGVNAVWLLSCRVGADLLNLALFLIVSRRFGPEGLGVYAYGFAIAGVINAVTMSGVEEYGIREYARRIRAGVADAHNRAMLSRLMSNLCGAQLCIAGSALALLAVYLWLTAPPAATLAIVLTLSTYQIGAAFASTLFVPAMAEQRMMEPAVTEFLCRAAAFILAGLSILLAEQPLQIALLGFAAAGTAMALLALRSSTRRGLRIRPHLALDVIRDGVRTLWSFAAVNALNQLFTRIGVIALTLQATSAAAGVYATGLKLVETLLLPIVFIGVAAYPRLSQAFGAETDFHHEARRLLTITLALTVVAAFGLYFVVPQVLAPLLGPRFAGAEPVIAAMAALLFVQAGEIVLGRLLLASNRHVARAACLSIGATLCIVATLIVTPDFGLEGALAVAVSAYLLVNVLYAFNARGALRREAATLERRSA